MCLMLYLATSGEQPLETAPELTIEEVDRADDTVRRWLSLPTVRFVGAHSGYAAAACRTSSPRRQSNTSTGCSRMSRIEKGIFEVCERSPNW
jgi:hypothetical protein